MISKNKFIIFKNYISNKILNIFISFYVIFENKIYINLYNFDLIYNYEISNYMIL